MRSTHKLRSRLAAGRVPPCRRVRFLFTTIQFDEADFYARVSERLRDEHGHEVAHVVISRSAAQAMRARGLEAHCLPDVIARDEPYDRGAEIARIEASYTVPSLRDVYLADPASAELDEAAAVERAISHVRALERVFAAVAPDVLIPEVGSETMRTVAQLIARARGVDSVLLFYTIFPNPLRMFLNTTHAPIVDADAVRELAPTEWEEVEAFIAAYTARDQPTVPHRRVRITPAKLRDFARHVAVRTTAERDNEYLRPGRFVTGFARQKLRAGAARRLYAPIAAGDRPFVYFPLHVTDDFKVKKVIPHCVDQGYLIRQVAAALPQGYDVVLKEHPASIGRNPVALLRGLTALPNVRLVDAHTSSHQLMQRAAAVVVISSTVGLEALLYARPVLTLGQPFYAGYGVTIDVDSFADIRGAVPEVLRFAPDRDLILRFLGAAMRSTFAGAPAGVDASDANAATVASSLHRALSEHRGYAQVMANMTPP